MAIHEAIHAGQLPASSILVGVAGVEALFPMHERVGLLLELLLQLWMLRQELLQFGMVLNEFPLVDEGRIFFQLLGDFGMAIQKAIHIRQFAARNIAVPSMIGIGLMPVIAVLAAHEGIGVFLDFFANFRMLLQVLLERRMILDELAVVH